MKKNFFLVVAIAAFVLNIHVAAQSSNKDLIREVLSNKNNSVTWLGADFSHVKIVGNLDCTAARFATEIVPAINDVVVMEPKKYDFAKYLNKAAFFADNSAVSKSNAAIKPDDMLQDTTVELKESDISNIVEKYDLKSKEGIGVVFIYESVSKTHLQAVIYLTYLKMPEGKLIFSKKVTAKPGGFGLRNYWAATIFNVLRDYREVYHDQWKSEYAVK